MAKESIGSMINSVTVEYASGANNQVESTLLNLLKAVIKSDIAAGHALTSIYVSATTNGTHESPRHASGQAIDISRVNGLHMSVNYPSDSTVKAIVDALQTQADAQTGIRENFGPHFKHKHAAAWSVAGHGDHIHWSVD
ncbi:MAG: hypothetical protein MUC88_03930 [Planctomycetes bacterium]|nr:hypothetical protein [Planctomycetota bacterium]